VKDFGGDALAANLLPESSRGEMISGITSAWFSAGAGVGGGFAPLQLLPGQIGGYIIDPTGAVVAGANVSVTQLDTGAQRNAVTDNSGRWIVGGMPSGRVRVTATMRGFRSTVREVEYNTSYPTSVSFSLQIGMATESVEIRGDDQYKESRSIERDLKKDKQQLSNAASSNVLDLQRRVSGVLPVRVDVPRAGNSYSFVRPLVLDEETKITFTYKTK
jgi:hypothetical protein